VVPQLIAFKRVVRPFLGVELAPDQMTRQWGLDGVMVMSVIPEGPAERAGLQGVVRDENGRIRPGDIIVALDDKRIRTARELFALLDRKQVGEVLRVTVLRDNERLEKQVTLAESPG